MCFWIFVQVNWHQRGYFPGYLSLISLWRPGNKKSVLIQPTHWKHGAGTDRQNPPYNQSLGANQNCLKISVGPILQFCGMTHIVLISVTIFTQSCSNMSQILSVQVSLISSLFDIIIWWSYDIIYLSPFQINLHWNVSLLYWREMRQLWSKNGPNLQIMTFRLRWGWESETEIDWLMDGWIWGGWQT